VIEWIICGAVVAVICLIGWWQDRNEVYEGEYPDCKREGHHTHTGGPWGSMTLVSSGAACPFRGKRPWF